MNSHWEDVKKVFEVLTCLIEETEPNVIELHFTASIRSYRSRNSTSLMERLKKRRPHGILGVEERLVQILKNYEENLRAAEDRHCAAIKNLFKKPKSVRPLNLYILTDEVWDHNINVNITGKIAHFVARLRKFGLPSEQLGIQFISFGKGPGGAENRGNFTDLKLVLRKHQHKPPSPGTLRHVVLTIANLCPFVVTLSVSSLWKEMS